MRAIDPPARVRVTALYNGAALCCALNDMAGAAVGDCAVGR